MRFSKALQDLLWLISGAGQQLKICVNKGGGGGRSMDHETILKVKKDDVYIGCRVNHLYTDSNEQLASLSGSI